MKVATLFWFGALFAASAGLLGCGGNAAGGPADGGVCPSFAMDGETCMTVGEVCTDNVQTCACTMGGGRGGAASWDCVPIRRDGGGFGGFGGRDGGGFGGFGGRDGGGRRGDGG